MANPEELLLLAAHMARAVPGDHQVITDEFLLAALDGRKRLSQAEYRRLLASPMTLSRLRILATQGLSDLRRSIALTGHESSGVVPVPEPHCEEITLVTNDGRWALLLKQDQGSQQWHLTLKLLVSKETMRLEEGEEIFVLDALQGTLCFGELDANSQLQAVWDRPVNPVHLVAKGMTWKVSRL